MNTLKPQSCSAGTTLICQVKEFHLPTSPHLTPSPGPAQSVWSKDYNRLRACTQKTLMLIHAVFSTNELAHDQFTLRFSHAVFLAKELAQNQFYIIKEWGFL